MIRVSIITVSDGVASGEREDLGGPACEAVLRAHSIPYEVVLRGVLPDDRGRVADLLREQADGGHVDLIVLTGGTGMFRDRTPEAVRDVAELEIPGLAEKMRSETGAEFGAGVPLARGGRGAGTHAHRRSARLAARRRRLPARDRGPPPPRGRAAAGGKGAPPRRARGSPFSLSLLEHRTGFGIDRLLADPSAVAGKRIGLITNPSGVTSRGIPTWQALLWTEAKLARLFGPEHGVDGSALYMEAVGNATHAASGLPAVSLYGLSVETRRPRPEHLEGLDAIVFDVADVGSRYYTYNWTMLLAMEACAAAGVRFIVCDRPNPLGGEVEGAPQDPEFLSFVGLHAVSVRHGMTTGELARLVLAETKLDLDLEVVPAIGWARATPYEETGLPWVPPSPNIPTVATARVYPGMALFEGTNLSEARGTTKPFEMFGAPWLSPPALSGALEALGLPGVSFLPVYFRPEFEKHAGVVCGGAAMHVTEPERFRGFETGLRIIETARQLDPREFRWRKEPYEFDPRPAVDLLSGSARFRETLDAGAKLSEEIARHRAGAEAFRKRREPYLIYPERRPAVVSFVGGHGAGKTTLLVELGAAAGRARPARGRHQALLERRRRRCRGQRLTAARRLRRRRLRVRDPRAGDRPASRGREAYPGPHPPGLLRLRPRARRGIQVARLSTDRGGAAGSAAARDRSPDRPRLGS